MEIELEFEPKKIIAVPVGEESILNEELQNQISTIPNRMAFKIGEVSQMADVKPYVLRYWEAEFEALRPKKSKHNQRVYERKDVENVLIIKKLLYNDKYSIEGARAALKRYRKQGKKAQALFEGRDDFEKLVFRAESLVEKIEKCLKSVS